MKEEDIVIGEQYEVCADTNNHEYAIGSIVTIDKLYGVKCTYRVKEGKRVIRNCDLREIISDEDKELNFGFEFHIEDEVYIKTDTDQKMHIITGILIRPEDIIYLAKCGTNEDYYHGFEMTKEKVIF